MKINKYRLTYHLKDTFGISRMSRNQVDALVIELTYQNSSGWGEATDNPYYNSNIEELQTQLENIVIPDDLRDAHPKTFYREYLSGLPIHPFLTSALDRAYWDAYSRHHRQNVLALMPWDWDQNEIPVSTYTIGLDHREKMAEKIQRTQWPLYKIKINEQDPVELLRYLRAFTEAPFLLDANGSLEIRQLEQLINNAPELNIKLIEQPLAQGEDHLLLPFIDQDEVRLAVDESIQSPDDLEKLRPYYHVANFKLMKNGGFTPCLDLLNKAQSLGYEKMMGCMTASSISIAAIQPFLPILDHVDMDGALLLTEDIASGILFEDGICQQPKTLGFGVEVNRKMMANLMTE